MTIIDVSSRYPISRPLYNLSAIDAIAIHHSVTRTLPATASQAEEIAVLDAIHRYHLGTAQLGGFAYHGAAFPSGRAYKTTTWARWGANVKGENDHLLGLVAIGTYTTTKAPLTLIGGLAELVDGVDKMLRRKVALRSHGRIYGGWTSTACPGLVNKQVASIRSLIQEEDDDMPTFFRNPKGAISIATAQGRRHISGTEWGAWRKAGGKYTQLTDGQYNAIPDYRNVDAQLARGIVLAIGTGQMNTPIRRGTSWTPPIDLRDLMPKGNIRQLCREAIVSVGIKIPDVHNAILAAIAGIKAGSGLTADQTVEAVKRANKEGTG